MSPAPNAMATKEASQQTNGWLSARSRRRDRRERRRDESDLPGWSDLSDEPASEDDAAQRGMSTIRFALIVAAVATGVTLYIGHVHATKAVRTDLQETRTENRRLHQELRQLKSEYHERTAPAVIYERARQIGLQEGPAFGPNIKVENRE